MDNPKYIIIEKIIISDLEREVNSKIKEGYKPIGGICCDTRNNFYQSMILEKKSLKGLLGPG